MSSNLFRKVALDRLSSPEQLDLLMPVTGPLAWLALLSGLLLLSAATYWGYKGQIDTRVEGEGILLKQGSIHDVVTLASGRVEKLFVKVDDEIKEGQLVAIISQPEIELQIQEAENQLRLFETDLELTHAYGNKTEELKLRYISEQRKSFEETIQADEQRLDFAKKQLEGRRMLFQEGLIPMVQVQEIADEQEKILQEIREHQNEFANLSAQEVELASQKEKETTSIESQISQTKERIRALKATRELRTRVISSSAGKVLELYAGVGKVVQTGEPLLTAEVIAPDNSQLTAVLYFPPRDGKRIYSGMEAQISPSVARPEEYGSLLGTVDQVSVFPASSRGMMQILQNSDLVSRLSSGGAPIMVHASLLSDSETMSGYKWSSGAGPPIQIGSGTICSVGVVVDRQRPVDLVVPYLRKKLLGEGNEDAPATDQKLSGRK